MIVNLGLSVLLAHSVQRHPLLHSLYAGHETTEVMFWDGKAFVLPLVVLDDADSESLQDEHLVEEVVEGHIQILLTNCIAQVKVVLPLCSLAV